MEKIKHVVIYQLKKEGRNYKKTFKTYEQAYNFAEKMQKSKAIVKKIITIVITEYISEVTHYND